MAGLATGRLDQRVTICRNVTASDGHGGRTSDWSDVATVWAEVVSQNGREAVLAGTLQGVSAVRVTIRHRSDISASDQLRMRDGRLFNIRSAEDPDGRRDALVIFADTAAVQ